MKLKTIPALLITALFLTGCIETPPPPTNATYLAPFYETRHNEYIALPADIPKTWIVRGGIGGNLSMGEDDGFRGYTLYLEPAVVEGDGPIGQVWYCVWRTGEESICDPDTDVPEECATGEIPKESGKCVPYSEPHSVTLEKGTVDLTAVVIFKRVDQEVQDFVLAQPLTFNWENRPWTKRIWESVSSYEELSYNK